MIYDVVLNFKKMAYEFYEWNKEDEILNVKQIMSYKVKTDLLLDFYYHDILVEKDFLKKIENKSQIFYKGINKKIDYACILYDDNIALAFLFDENGNVILKSKLLFEESDEIILNGKNNEETSINYEVIKYNKINNYKTRKELKIINVLNDYLQKKALEKNYDELKYMYFEIFDEKIEDENKILKILENKINNLNYEELRKMLEIIRVLKK